LLRALSHRLVVIKAIFIYNVIVDTGFFDTIRDSLAGVSNDRRIQVVPIAFVFGALLEATAGFGTPVAITASLMAGLGFEALYRRRWRCLRTPLRSRSAGSAYPS
jgi:lactate permease